MAAYYNEFDPFAAAWLRELIKSGVIADGEVDERSIEDVLPSELRSFTQCHFFAGIGVWSYALRSAGWPDDRRVWTGSCPCQPFSTAGKRKGAADERHLWPALFHLIQQAKPASVPLFGEQVASTDGLAWLDLVQADLEAENHAFWPYDLCAAGFGAPHIRQRLYYAGIGDLADAAGEGRQPGRRWSGQPGQPSEDAAAHGETGILADAEHDGHSGAGTVASEPGSNGPDNGIPVRGGGRIWTATGELADAGSSRSQGDGLQPLLGGGSRGEQTREQPQWSTSGPSSACQLGDAEQQGLEGLTGAEPDWHQPGRIGEIASGSVTAPGATNGFWREADWLWCRDEKFRPVEPGTFPLAHGSTNRVGRLRGYGNALAAPQAEEFIRAYLEVIGEV